MDPNKDWTRHQDTDSPRTVEFLLFLQEWIDEVKNRRLPSVDTMYGPLDDERTVAEEISEILAR